MPDKRRHDAGFTLMDLTITVAVFAIASAIAIPTMSRTVESMRVRMAARDVERELQAARLQAVSSNRPMRIRFNCPSAGQYRVVELIGSPSVPDSLDGDSLRCSENAFPFPASDNDPLTRPNNDRPLRRLPQGVSFGNVQTIEFWPNGTARINSGGTTPWPRIPVQGITVSVVKGSTTRSMTVTGLGKITLQ